MKRKLHLTNELRKNLRSRLSPFSPLVSEENGQDKKKIFSANRVLEECLKGTNDDEVLKKIQNEIYEIIFELWDQEEFTQIREEMAKIPLLVLEEFRNVPGTSKYQELIKQVDELVQNFIDDRFTSQFYSEERRGNEKEEEKRKEKKEKKKKK